MRGRSLVRPTIADLSEWNGGRRLGYKALSREGSVRRLGLIGGISWESTVVCYRQLNALVRTQRGGLGSAELLLHSLDFADVAACQMAGDWNGAATVLADAAEGLVRVGAEGVLICSNAMHLVSAQLAGRIASPSPTARLIDIIDETGFALRAKDMRRPLLLAKRYTMGHGFYAGQMRRYEIEVMIPDIAERTLVHDVIFNELCQGMVRAASRNLLMQIIARGLDTGADSVILSCTEICLLLDRAVLPYPGFDSTAIHTEAAVAFALGGDKLPVPEFDHENI